MPSVYAGLVRRPQWRQRTPWRQHVGQVASQAQLAALLAQDALLKQEAEFYGWQQLDYVSRQVTAAKTFNNGPTGPSVQGAPLPLVGETWDRYFPRVMGGNWKPGSAGFNIGDPSTWKPALQGAANALGIVAAAFGLVGAGQFVYLLSAAAGNGSPAELATALKADYDNFQSSADLAQAVENGDWAKVWNVVTADGTKLEALQNAFSPGPAPDAQGNLTIPPAPATFTPSAAARFGGSALSFLPTTSPLRMAVAPGARFTTPASMLADLPPRPSKVPLAIGAIIAIITIVAKLALL